ncbi:MAG TPA: ATP-binding protein [Terriglobales bacterium]|nr:ATP-binding protein [Terriglobales bacterium]
MPESEKKQRSSKDESPDRLAHLARAVEQSADLVLITDRNGVIEYVNPAFETLTGYTRDEAVGRNARLLKSGLHDPAFYEELWSTILAGSVFRGALADRKKNGEIFFLEKTITPIRDANNEIVRFISNDRDITDRRRLEAQLQQVQRMEALEAFAGGVAHDFNNLLMVMSAYAELTLEALSSDSPLRSNINEILQATRRATDLTRQLLAFSRKPKSLVQSLDLNSVLRDLGCVLPRLLGEKVHLQMVLGEDLRNAKADPAEIEQVILNLAGNARDAMPNGGHLRIQTSMVELEESYVQHHAVATAGEYVLLTMVDSGEGIAPEHMAHIFEPFYTTKPRGKGTGLGLATAYAVVKQCGGHIWVYSEKGLGTTFKIYIPTVGKKPAQASVSLAPDAPSGTETILLVEDDPALRKSEMEFLKASGYTVLEASDSEDAVETARSYSGVIHLMITDVVLPKMDGTLLAEKVLGLRPQMKLLFISGFAEHSVSQRGLVNSEGNFLEKPFTRRILAEKVRQILGASGRAMAASV